MNILLWIIQVLLAAAFGLAGFAKVSQPLEALGSMIPWVTAVPVLLVRSIGVAEIAGALGLILPGLTKIQPRLTAFAGVGLVLVMLLGSAFHASRGEFGNIPVNLVLLVLAAFVAYSRWPRAQKLTQSPA
jgi:putative oxidoreductase